MLEYITEAVVLDAEPNGDLDSRISLFTKSFGKLVAKAKSARKITSKLASHLQPGNAVRLRLVEKNGLQVVDALKTSALQVALSDLLVLNRLLAEAEPDVELWQLLRDETFSWLQALKLLGWDPQEAQCSKCNGEPTHFTVHGQEFFCDACSSKFPRDAIVCIYPRAA